MHFSPILALATVALAAPVLEKRYGSGVLDGGWIPNPTADQMKAIAKQAHGSVPNGQLPTSIADATALAFSLIAVNEIFETQYFTSLLHNMTTKAPGYEKATQAQIDAIGAIQAQEETHAQAANAVLKTAGRPVISECEYQFPVSDLDSAILFANTFTDLVLGTLGSALTTFAKSGDIAFEPIIAAVISQEGEQTGFFRYSNGHVPSASPFLTAAAPVFAYSALNHLVIKPGSCKQSLPIPILPNLAVSPMPTGDQVIRFTYPGSDCNDVSLAYINQQNVPLVYPITKCGVSNGMVTFTTNFRYSDNLLNGLSIAAIVKSDKGPYNSAADVAMYAVAGPALIEVN